MDNPTNPPSESSVGLRAPWSELIPSRWVTVGRYDYPFSEELNASSFSFDKKWVPIERREKLGVGNPSIEFVYDDILFKIIRVPPGRTEIA